MNVKEDQLPVATAVPILTTFAAIPAVQVPQTSGFAKVGLAPHIYGIMQQTNAFTIREQVKLMPEYCFGCPPCLTQGKSYYITAGNDAKGTNFSGMLFRADEVSEAWNRCCCHPMHPWKMEFRQYIPMPGEIQGQSSEAQIFGQDLMSSWDQMSVSKRTTMVKEAYMKQPVAFTAIRDGQQCLCCNSCAFRKMLGCFACCECCRDGVTVVAGTTSEAEGHEIGLVPSTANAIGFSQVPFLGGHCTPTLHLSHEPFPTENVFGKIQGPTCFGGCSELCCDFEFPVSRFSSEDKIGDVARITKRRPRGGFAAMRELFSQNDVFTIEFTDKSLTPEDKALILGNQLLLDFMFFEGGENEMCGQTEDGKGCYILLCNWYCYGVLCPCKLVFKNQKQ